MSLPRKLSKYKQAHSKTIQNSIEYPIYVFPKQQQKKKSFKSANHILATSQGIEADHVLS